jgi:phospholipid/cholesterol/gamma-HCH transport system substrate-binding protein
MTPLRERNQVAVAIVGTILIAAVVLVSMNLDLLPFAEQHAGYHAQFANASGLRVGDDVRVEGIDVGEVTAIHVVGDRVQVDFTARSGLALGGASNASIEVATVLGQVFLQVESHGPGTLASGGTIPLSRTTVPFTLVSALDAFGSFSNRTDLPKLRASLRTLATTISGVAPADARAALNGLAAVSRTLAAKQQQIGQILDAASRITDTVNANSGALVQLLTQGDQFLQLLKQRQAVIADLLTDTAHLGSELSELMQRNAAQLAPLLANLAGVTKVLAQDKDELAAAVTRLGSFSVNLSNATGAGPWLDLLVPVALTPDNVIRACGVHPDSTNGPCG